ncbi:MAG: HEAT repeat domain-containing protein [Promethearchaeota archaeon]
MNQVDLSEFYRLRKLGQKLGRIKSKNCTEDLFTLSELWLLGGYPSKKIQRKAKRILNHRFPQKYNNITIENWNQYIPQNLSQQWMQFQIFFLIDSSFSLYYSTYQKILKNKELFHPYLIEGLIHSEEAVQLNCAKILSKIYPANYPVPSSNTILAGLNDSQKSELHGKLENRLNQTKDLTWYSKEDIIVKLGALQDPKALEIMEKMIGDPEPNVRMQLAHTLKRIRSEAGIKLLYLLLLDQSAGIREEAAKSLGFLIPGLYKKKSFREILGSLSPAELLEIVVKTESCLNLDNIWRKHNLHPEIIQKFMFPSEASEEDVLTAYLQWIRESEGDSQIQSLLLIIFSRGHTFLHYLDHILQSRKYNSTKDVLIELQRIIQENFTVKKEDGFQILL